MQRVGILAEPESQRKPASTEPATIEPELPGPATEPTLSQQPKSPRPLAHFSACNNHVHAKKKAAQRVADFVLWYHNQPELSLSKLITDIRTWFRYLRQKNVASSKPVWMHLATTCYVNSESTSSSKAVQVFSSVSSPLSMAVPVTVPDDDPATLTVSSLPVQRSMSRSYSRNPLLPLGVPDWSLGGGHLNGSELESKH